MEEIKRGIVHPPPVLSLKKTAKRNLSRLYPVKAAIRWTVMSALLFLPHFIYQTEESHIC
jgi:hypothetical protein